MTKIKHGLAGSRTYRIWTGIKQRCENPSRPEYANYGGRGIKVCDRWQRFENFLADMGECPRGWMIERKGNNGDYTRENCIWTTVEVQANNKRNNLVVEFGGKRLTLAQWSRELGIPRNTLVRRYRNGWAPEKILSKKSQRDLTNMYAARDKHFASRTHCKHGHELSEGNIHFLPNGQRQCRECNRRRAREWQRAHRK